MANQKTQQEVLRWASSFLKEHQKEEHIAYLVLAHYLDVSRATLFANMREKIATDKEKKIIDAIKKHALTDEPIQHIIGSAPFYGRDFFVNDSVLIPRFETEELVEQAISVAKQLPTKHMHIVDIGTGSGVIAISLKKALPEAEVYATDISEAALEVARKNARWHHASITFYQGDFLQPIIEHDITPTLIISNPPYIDRKEYEKLSDTVRHFDPHLALFAEENGLKAYQEIITQSTALNRVNLHAFLFEIGYAQKEAVTKIIKETYPDGDLKDLQDINGKDRILVKYLK